LVVIVLNVPNSPVARNFQEFPKFAEISTISQIFLDNHIRNKIPSIFHIHHIPVYDADLKGDDALPSVGGGNPPHGAISRPYTGK
jgi:hypothetical protein